MPSKAGDALDGWAHDGKTPPEVLRGRYEFHRSFSDLARGKRNWQWAAALSLVLLGFAVVGLVTLATQSRVVPYVVEVDRMGRAEAVAPAEAVPLAEDRVVVAALSSFVTSIRTVYADPVAQRDAVYRAYAYVAGDAREFLEGYFSDPQNDPRRLGKDFRRAVEVTGVLPVPVADGAIDLCGRTGSSGTRPHRSAQGGTTRAGVGGLPRRHARPSDDDRGRRAQPARRVRDRPLVEPARRLDARGERRRARGRGRRSRADRLRRRDAPPAAPDRPRPGPAGRRAVRQLTLSPCPPAP